MAEVTLAVRCDDDEAHWVLGTTSRREARACVARERGTRRWTVRAVPGAVQSISGAECAAANHPPERCMCWRRREDWYQRCAPTDPGARVAWRIEPSAAVRCWRALRALSSRVTGRGQRSSACAGRAAAS